MDRPDLRRGEGLASHGLLTARRAAALAFAALGPPLAAAEPVLSNRWHFAFDAEPAFRVSVLFRRAEAGDETKLLVTCGSARLVLTSRQTAGGRESLERVDDPASGAFLERRIWLSGHGSVPACRGVERPDACVVFASEGGTVTTSISALSGEKAASRRAELRRLAAPDLEKRVLAVAPVFPRFADFRFYRDDFLALVWPEAFPPANRTETGRPEPGCAYDAAFGFPCDARNARTEAFRFRKR